MEEKKSGATDSAVGDAKRRCAALSDRLQRMDKASFLPHQKLLSRLIHSELTFLHRLSVASDSPSSPLRVVPDCPSKRMMSLPTTRKLDLKNKMVFGTGDYWCAPTVTANMAFVRSVTQTGMSLSTIELRPRALIGD